MTRVLIGKKKKKIYIYIYIYIDLRLKRGGKKLKLNLPKFCEQ
jgi:hypothetical protein